MANNFPILTTEQSLVSSLIGQSVSNWNALPQEQKDAFIQYGSTRIFTGVMNSIGTKIWPDEFTTEQINAAEHMTNILIQQWLLNGINWTQAALVANIGTISISSNPNKPEYIPDMILDIGASYGLYRSTMAINVEGSQYSNENNNVLVTKDFLFTYFYTKTQSDEKFVTFTYLASEYVSYDYLQTNYLSTLQTAELYYNKAYLDPIISQVTINTDAINILQLETTGLAQVKQDKTDNQLNTSTKVVVDAINGINTGLGNQEIQLTQLTQQFNNLQTYILSLPLTYTTNLLGTSGTLTTTASQIMTGATIEIDSNDPTKFKFVPSVPPVINGYFEINQYGVFSVQAQTNIDATGGQNRNLTLTIRSNDGATIYATETFEIDSNVQYINPTISFAITEQQFPNINNLRLKVYAVDSLGTTQYYNVRYVAAIRGIIGGSGGVTTSDQITNLSNVNGANVTAALNTLNITTAKQNAANIFSGTNTFNLLVLFNGGATIKNSLSVENGLSLVTGNLSINAGDIVLTNSAAAIKNGITSIKLFFNPSYNGNIGITNKNGFIVFQITDNEILISNTVINMSNNRITNVSVPSQNADAATKGYTDQKVYDSLRQGTLLLSPQYQGSYNITDIYNFKFLLFKITNNNNTDYTPLTVHVSQIEIGKLTQLQGINRNGVFAIVSVRFNSSTNITITVGGSSGQFISISGTN